MLRRTRALTVAGAATTVAALAATAAAVLPARNAATEPPAGRASAPAAGRATAPATGPSGAPVNPAAGTPDGWRLVWSDDFQSGPDRTKWNVRRAEARDVDLGCNTDSPANAFVANGRLVLRALRRQVRCGAQTRAYTQPYLDTVGRASWTYGRFEIRARSPNGPGDSTGLWPAFWLRPDDGGNGEIDVVELPGGQRWYAEATQSIFWDYSPVKQENRAWPTTGGYPGDGFHTYTTEWEPGALSWYIDGRPVWRRDRGTTPWFDAAFAKPYNLRLNVQVGGWLGAPDAGTAFPADFVVDYVRVWQR